MSVLDLFKKKQKTVQEPDSFKEKLARHRLSVVYRIVIAVLLVAGVVGFFIIQMRNRLFEQWKEEFSGEFSQNSEATLETLGENALFYSHDGAYCVNRKGETVWNQTFEMQEPIIDIRDSEMAIGDYNGHTIYVMSADSIVGTIDTGKPIKSLAVSGQGIVAAVLDDSDNVTWIYLYAPDGSAIAYFKTTMGQSGYPLKTAISDNGELVAISYLYMDSLSMKTSVAFYNFGPVGRNEIDNFVSSYDYTDAITPFVRFLGNGNAVALGDSRLSFYAGDQKPISVAEVLLDGVVKSVYWGGDYVALVYNDTSGQSNYKIDIYNKEGELCDTIYESIALTDIAIKGDKIIIYNSQECRYRTIGGNDNFSGEFPEPITKLIPLEKNHQFMVLTGSEIKVLKLI